MPYDFKSDLAKYKGQDTAVGGLTDIIGGVDKKVPVFGEDIQQYKSTGFSPGGNALKLAAAEASKKAAEQPKQEDQPQEQPKQEDQPKVGEQSGMDEKAKADYEARKQKADADRAAKLAENEAKNQQTIANKKQEITDQKTSLEAEIEALTNQEPDPTKIDLVQQEEKRQQQERIDKMLSELPDVTDEEAVHASLAPDQILPTSNLEVDPEDPSYATAELTSIPEGTVGGECGVFARTITRMEDGSEWRSGADDYQGKAEVLGNYRERGQAYLSGEEQPKPGQSVLINTGTPYGHVAVVNSVNDDGTLTLTESNWGWDKKVSHTRKISMDDPQIYGYYKTK